jgi:predicted  nucleic acid-binding Zn-ribbon protein
MICCFRPMVSGNPALGDTSMVNGADEQWMTYAELAIARGITKASANRLVRRHKWRRQIDNHGHVRVLVPGAIVSSDEKPDIDTDSMAGIARAITSLHDAMSVWQEQIERERRRADQAELRAEAADTRADSAEKAVRVLEGQLAAGGADIDRERAAFADQVAALQEQMDALRADLDRERSRADQAEARANRAERRADDAIARADHVEVRAEVERERAETAGQTHDGALWAMSW